MLLVRLETPQENVRSSDLRFLLLVQEAVVIATSVKTHMYV